MIQQSRPCLSTSDGERGSESEQARGAEGQHLGEEAPESEALPEGLEQARNGRRLGGSSEAPIVVPDTPPKPRGKRKAPPMTDEEKEREQRREAYMRDLAQRDRWEAAQERKEEERAAREARRKAQEEEDRILGCDYTKGPMHTQEEHACMHEVLAERDQVVKRVPGGPNNLFYCVQRWAQLTGYARLYGRSVEDLRSEMSDRILTECRHRAREEALNKRVGDVDEYINSVREQHRIDRTMLEQLCNMVQGKVQIICPIQMSDTEGASGWTYEGNDRGVDWEEEDPVMTLAWVHDKEEGELNHLHVIHKTQTKGEFLTQACNFPPYANQREHEVMWAATGAGPPRKPVKGGLGLYQGLTGIKDSPLSALSATAAAEKVADEVDRQEREDCETRETLFEGEKGQAVRTRAVVHIEALLAIKELLDSPITIHIPGDTPTEMRSGNESSDTMVHLIMYHHQSRGYANSWMVRQCDTRSATGSSESDSEEDNGDKEWGAAGAEGFWDWEERRRPIPRDRVHVEDPTGQPQRERAMMLANWAGSLTQTAPETCHDGPPRYSVCQRVSVHVTVPDEATQIAASAHDHSPIHSDVEKQGTAIQC
mmetsp:Transcript_29285/g.59997  ORF Transcript_29285/g.59997 Transcript_29285/m.59997 type:complete len:597 (-) Transcript_29285:57-1847(-)